MTYPWLKVLHIVFMVTWFAGLFYLPRLYVYHAQPQPQAVNDLFKIMERRLFGIMTIGAVVTVAFGLWLIFAHRELYVGAGWLHAKIFVATLLIAYHAYCYRLMRDFALDRNRRSERWYRIFNELPVVALILIVILVIVRPF